MKDDSATSYSVHGLVMLPFYICYSMFDFQRVGDQIWTAADQHARGYGRSDTRAALRDFFGVDAASVVKAALAALAAPKLA